VERALRTAVDEIGHRVALGGSKPTGLTMKPCTVSPLAPNELEGLRLPHLHGGELVLVDVGELLQIRAVRRQV